MAVKFMSKLTVNQLKIKLQLEAVIDQIELKKMLELYLSEVFHMLLMKICCIGEGLN